MLTCSKCGKFIAHPGAQHVCESVERAVGAEDASKPGDVVGSVRDERGAVGLIERLEGATGPNFALEVEISRLLLPDVYFGRKVIDWFQAGAWFGCNTDDGFRHLEAARVGKYTSSIDAAMTLVPEGWWVAECGQAMHDGKWFWEVQLLNGPRNAYTGFNSGVRPPTFPLAMCIAALKARTVQSQERTAPSASTAEQSSSAVKALT